eukprot:6179856-Pleurochrysis_carterae.AAC.8
MLLRSTPRHPNWARHLLQVGLAAIFPDVSCDLQAASCDLLVAASCVDSMHMLVLIPCLLSPAPKRGSGTEYERNSACTTTVAAD